MITPATVTTIIRVTLPNAAAYEEVELWLGAAGTPKMESHGVASYASDPTERVFTLTLTPQTTSIDTGRPIEVV